MDRCDILGVPVSTLGLDETVEQVYSWASSGGQTRTVTFANAHMLALAWQQADFCQLLRSMDMNCPDGAPLAVFMRYLAALPNATSVPGPDFMPAFCRRTAHTSIRHYFFGGGPRVAETAAERLAAKNPGLHVAGFASPPFGAVSEEALRAQCAAIAASGANVVWVALGCPKQEIWISRASKLLSGVVLLAVGQAMNIESGVVTRAPVAIRKIGCEWLYRLLNDPRRLWKRYLVYNSIFLYSIARYRLKWK